MPVPVSPRWSLLVAQACLAALAPAGVLLGLVVAGSAPLLALALVVVALVAPVGGVLWLEVVKTRRVASLAVGPDAEQLSHAERVRSLTESRRTIVDAFEIERARVERDLHDGAQQYLVAASMKMGEAALALDELRAAHPDERAVALAADLVARAQDDNDGALAALRRTVAGVHSRLLAEQGLEAALRELVGRFTRPGNEVILRVPHPLPPLPPGVASAAWFFTSEALTNAAKYAPDARVSVVVSAGADLHVSVVDDGPGGAVLAEGGGLAGMRERLRAFGGDLEVSSPPGGPTGVAARVPLLLRAGEPGTAPGPAPGVEEVS